MKNPLLLSIAVIGLAGCNSAPSVADHRDEAIKQVQSAEEAAIAAFAKRDGELSGSFYAPDATLMMANGPILKGAAVKSALKEMMTDPNFSMSFETAKFEASKSGELGYTTGKYTLTMTDSSTKKKVRETGKYVTIYAQQPDGNWKIVDDISTPDGPAVPVDGSK